MEMRERVSGLDAEHVVFGCVFALSNRLQRVLDAAMPDLTAKQFWLLIVLSLFPEAPTLTELAEVSDTSHQNVRQLVGKLESKGFVELIDDPCDLRTIRIRTTEKAVQWGADTDKQARDFMASMFAELGHKDIEVLADRLLSLHESLGHLSKRMSGRGRSGSESENAR